MEAKEDIEAPPDASQASSHFHLDPVSGQVLFRREAARRDLLRERGNYLSGCRELDAEALSGGFERGCVVGVSSELEDFGLLVSARAKISTLQSISPELTQMHKCSLDYKSLPACSSATRYRAAWVDIGPGLSSSPPSL